MRMISKEKYDPEYDYIIHHICACGHEQRHHTVAILDENTSECEMEGCLCWRFVP
jgi:hypothetical protein